MQTIAQSIRYVLAVILLCTNVLFAHQVETSIWRERKLALSALVIPAKAGIQSSSRLRTGTASTSRHNVDSGTGHGNDGFKKPTVVLIQDVHMNAEAQESIRQTLVDLIQKKEVALVGLEGAFGPLDFSGFQTYEDQPSVRAAADFLLKEKVIPGAVHAGLTAGSKAPVFVGVDDRQHYQANVEAYKNSVGLAGTAKVDLALRERALAKKIRETYSPRLRSFDADVRAYRSGKLEFGAYVKRLARECSSVPPATALFLSALQKEKELNFSQIDSERSQLLHSLVPKLDKKGSSDLLDLSQQYRTGDVTPVQFFERVANLCRKKGLPLSKYPSLIAYMEYVALADRLDVSAVLSETKKMEDSAYKSLARTEPERRLVESSRKLYLTGKLVDFSLTKEEWQEYQNLRHVPLPSGEGAGVGKNRSDRSGSAPPLTPPLTGRGTSAAGGVSQQLEDMRVNVVGDCHLCPLGDTRIKLVFGVGNPETDVMFIGEGPGFEEDRKGEPFVGKAGQLLDKIIGAIGLDRTKVYIANMVKCHPMTDPSQPDKRGNDRAPSIEEMEKCRPFLMEQIRIIRPKIIVTLGGVSSKALLNTTRGITALRGNLVDLEIEEGFTVKVLPTFHPAALLRDETLKKSVWEDMKLLRELLAISSKP